MYDLPFLHWLYRTGKEVDFISDDDFESFGTARTLARLYDLIVFPGHEHPRRPVPRQRRGGASRRLRAHELRQALVAVRRG
jgi:hypothetical protein